MKSWWGFPPPLSRAPLRQFLLETKAYVPKNNNNESFINNLFNINTKDKVKSIYELLKEKIIKGYDY